MILFLFLSADLYFLVHGLAIVVWADRYRLSWRVDRMGALKRYIISLFLTSLSSSLFFSPYTSFDSIFFLPHYSSADLDKTSVNDWSVWRDENHCWCFSWLQVLCMGCTLLRLPFRFTLYLLLLYDCVYPQTITNHSLVRLK